MVISLSYVAMVYIFMYGGVWMCGGCYPFVDNWPIILSNKLLVIGVDVTLHFCPTLFGYWYALLNKNVITNIILFFRWLFKASFQPVCMWHNRFNLLILHGFLQRNALQLNEALLLVLLLYVRWSRLNRKV